MYVVPFTVIKTPAKYYSYSQVSNLFQLKAKQHVLCVYSLLGIMCDRGIMMNGLPRWRCGKESCQSKRHRRSRFSPWLGIAWSGKWYLAPVFLPGESHGQRGLVGYSL